MKATIKELWDTGREIICYEGQECSRPTQLSDLKECTNVLLSSFFLFSRLTFNPVLNQKKEPVNYRPSLQLILILVKLFLFRIMP